LTIIQVDVSGKGFDRHVPSLPLTLAAGESVTFTASFAPVAIGNNSGSLLITKSQPDSSPLWTGSASGKQSLVSQATIEMIGAGVALTPSITTQPIGEAVTAGETARFLVAASGGLPLSYQWRKNGTAINGATSPIYTIPVTTSADNGSQFTVSVNNAGGSVISNIAMLSVSTAGQLTTSATALNFGNIIVGSSSTLAVALTNVGGTSISILNVTLSGAGLSTGGVSSGLILAAGSSANLNVTFTPSAAGTLNGSVSVISDALNPTVTVSLLCTAVQPVSHSVTLNLTPNSSNVVGYNVYRSSVSNGPYTKLNSPLVTSTTYTDTAVLASQTYFYVGTSVDSAGNETADSNQVSATIPTPY